MKKETEECIGCEKQFPEEEISHSSGEPMCEKCESGFLAEIKQSGIDKLDEYLKERGLQEDFNIFCSAKFSLVTEEEIVEGNENSTRDTYRRWKLSDIIQGVPDLLAIKPQFQSSQQPEQKMGTEEVRLFKKGEKFYHANLGEIKVCDDDLTWSVWVEWSGGRTNISRKELEFISSTTQAKEVEQTKDEFDFEDD